MWGNMHIEANAVTGSFPIWNWNYNSEEKKKYGERCWFQIQRQADIEREKY